MLIREKALRVAEAELRRGVKEDPAGSNSGPRVNLYLRSAGLGPGYPWCMAFLAYCFQRAGGKLNPTNPASVGFFEAWAAANGYLVEQPQPGDIVCYRFDADNWPDHVGIVKEAGPTRIRVIEGNTAVGNDAEGGRVMLRSRSLSRCRFVRIPGDVPTKPKPAPASFGPSTTTNANVTVTYDYRWGERGLMVAQNPENPKVKSRLRRLVQRFGEVRIRKPRS